MNGLTQPPVSREAHDYFGQYVSSMLGKMTRRSSEGMLRPIHETIIEIMNEQL